MKFHCFFAKHLRTLKKNEGGSVLIFSLVVFMVASFVVAAATQSTQKLTGEQSDLITYQKQKAFLDSYVSYLKKNSVNLLEVEDAYFGDIDYSLTRQTESIDGFLESGESSVYSFTDPTDITVQWNKCVSGQQGAMEITTGVTLLVKADASSDCGDPNSVFDDSHDLMGVTALTLTAWDAPLNFRIKSNDVAVEKLVDNKWHFTYQLDLDGQDVLEGVEVFE